VLIITVKNGDIVDLECDAITISAKAIDMTIGNRIRRLFFAVDSRGTMRGTGTNPFVAEFSEETIAVIVEAFDDRRRVVCCLPDCVKLKRREG